MLTFKKIEVKDGIWMRAIAEKEGAKSVDFNFVSNLLWAERHDHRVARIGDRFAIRLQLDGREWYSFPVGSGDLKEAMQALEEDARERGHALRICGALEQHIEELHALGINDFEAVAWRPAYDYVYDAESLANLPGKKYHGKRNHIHRFEENEGWYYKRMQEEDFPACRAFLKEWYAAQDPNDEGFRAEAAVMEKTFEHFKDLNLYGGMLYIKDRMVALTIGDHYLKDSLEVIFEKAVADVQGSYTMINREFVRMMREIFPGICYINREDDMGLEGLRKAKMDYHPIFLVEKYNLFFDPEDSREVEQVIE